MKKKILIISMMITILAMMLNIFCFAESDTNLTENSTGNINVSGVQSGSIVTLYKLTTVNFINNQPFENLYTWEGNIKDWLINSSEYSSYTDPKNFYETFFDIEGSDSEGTNADLAKFYSALASEIKSGAIHGLTAREEMANSSGMVTFTELKMGTYLIVVDNRYVYSDNRSYIYRATAANLTPSISRR